MSCEVCHDGAAKYRCPGCQLRSCGLKCVKQHKVASGCSGIRNKTAYVRVRNFTDINLLSDYRFLEEVSRKSDTSQRDGHNRRDKPKYLKRLANFAKKRDITLLTMPHGFSRRKQNSSFICHAINGILWTVEWVFPQVGAKFTERKVPEDKVLNECLDRFFKPGHGDPVLQHKLRKYVQEGRENVLLFMKVEKRPANSPRYYSFDPAKSLTDNLHGKTVLEFPSIYVVLKEHASDFKILGQDGCNSSQVSSSSSEESSEESETKMDNVEKEAEKSGLIEKETDQPTGTNESESLMSEENHIDDDNHTELNIEPAEEQVNVSNGEQENPANELATESSVPETTDQVSMDQTSQDDTAKDQKIIATELATESSIPETKDKVSMDQTSQDDTAKDQEKIATESSIPDTIDQVSMDQTSQDDTTKKQKIITTELVTESNIPETTDQVSMEQTSQDNTAKV